jgi:hypothetical protein
VRVRGNFVDGSSNSTAGIAAYSWIEVDSV